MFSLLSVLFYGLLFDSFSGGSSNNRIHFTLLTKYILLTTQWDRKGKELCAKAYSTGNAKCFRHCIAAQRKEQPYLLSNSSRLSQMGEQPQMGDNHTETDFDSLF